VRDGWEGWDAYAPFYDWENARTAGRRDVEFWRRVASEMPGPILELGCGTGRISVPLVRAGVNLVGIDRSTPMLARLRDALRRARRRPASAGRRRRPNRGALPLVRGDIRALPFADGSFGGVVAPYGVLQSLVRDRDLRAALASVSRVLEPGGRFGVDLVPDVPRWREYRDRVQLEGRSASGSHLTLIESVRQDRRLHLTTFEQRYVERRDRRVTEHRFELVFRTVSVRRMTERLEQAGFAIERVLGDYQGGPLDRAADVWIILAKKR
jgi:SAM-dependent methyltransferase